MPWNPAALKQFREQRGLSQKALAHRVGVHRVTIARIETSRKPSIDLLEALAKALKVGVADLLRADSGKG